MEGKFVNIFRFVITSTKCRKGKELPRQSPLPLHLQVHDRLLAAKSRPLPKFQLDQQCPCPKTGRSSEKKQPLRTHQKTRAH